MALNRLSPVVRWPGERVLSGCGSRRRAMLFCIVMHHYIAAAQNHFRIRSAEMLADSRRG